MLKHYLACFVVLLCVTEGLSLECWVGAKVNDKSKFVKQTCSGKCSRTLIEAKIGGQDLTTTTLGCTALLGSAMCDQSSFCSGKTSGMKCESSCCSKDLCNNGMMRTAGYMSLWITALACVLMYIF